MKKKIYIAGAHSRAQTLAAYISYLYPQTVIEAYLVDNEEENAKSINGIPVIHLDKVDALNTGYPVFIATRGVYHDKIKAVLKKYGIREIYPVTVELDMKIRNAYLRKYFADIGRKFVKIDDLECNTQDSRLYNVTKETNARVYVAKSESDKKLEKPYCLKPYEKVIWCGAALTENSLNEGLLADNTGENISNKNKQYCELTALYWIWKHAGEDIVGLAHYRRHFLLPGNWESRMKDNAVDAILAVPLYVAPSLVGNYKSRHDVAEWEIMMQYLKEHNINEYGAAEAFFEKNLYSPCNMFIMRKEVLDELCTWLFPIIDAVVAHIGKKEDVYLNRYPGFLSERLITFFFEYYRNKYKVVYADKDFFV